MKMRIVLFVALCATPVFSFAAIGSFQRSLGLGMRGNDVREMQKVLNSDTETLIAVAGAGSPGNETDYFGPRTMRALVKFQEKYAREVLTPAGLAHGNGYVGLYTRTKLNALSVLTMSVGGKVATSGQVAPPRPASATTTTASLNPNLENIDLYIDKIKENGIKQGLSSSTLSLLENKIRIGAATTTDFRKQFFDYQRAMYEKKVSENTPRSPVFAFLDKAISFVGEIFSIKKANALLGLPFGGYLVYVNPIICDCPTPGLITQLFVASANPNPLQSNLLMNYINGSELFNWHNIPMPGIAVLGMYIPDPLSCWTWIPATPPFCVPIPAEGLITPEVGSSLLPL